MTDIFIDTLVNEENAPYIFNISLILADSEKREIQEKAIENIKIIVKEDWHAWSNIRDAYIYLDFYSVDIMWYKKYLVEKRKISWVYKADILLTKLII